jgi:putative FmdB family regulatory protein
MPIYRYTCPACDIFVEELRPMRFSDARVECPICHTLCVQAIAQVNVIGRATVDRADDGDPAPHAFDPTCSCCLRRAAG